MGNRVFHPKVDSKVDGSSPGPTSIDSRYVCLSFLKLEDSCKHEKTEAGGERGGGGVIRVIWFV